MSEVAHTILNQLGAGRFVAMTGAKNFTSSANGLTFQIPRSNKIRGVRVVLKGNDLYQMEFLSITGTKVAVVATEDDIYADMLQERFTKHTGLYTRF